jgi:PPOX class probable F420-dependent enzyme
MSAALPESAKQWLDGTSFPVIATVDPDGRPQLSVVWAKRDGDTLLFSTLRDRRKGRNLSRDPSVTVLVTPDQQAARRIIVRVTADHIVEYGD